MKKNNQTQNTLCTLHITPYTSDHKGITLIALIITIIVMIILVGVTVSVALNGGLFDIAKQAAEQTQYQADYETLQAAVIAAMASEEGITQSSLQANLPSGWTVTETKSGTYTVESPSENEFTVKADGSITSQTGEETEDDDLAFLKKYFLGENEEGKDFFELVEDFDIYTTSDITDITYADDDSTDDINESEAIISLNFGPVNPYTSEENGEIYYYYNFYVKYKDNAVYSVGVKVDENAVTWTTISVELKYTPQGKEGQDLGEVTGDDTYDDWTIIYDNLDGTVEAVSPTTVGSLTLGYTDSTVDWEDEAVKAEANLDGDESLSNVEKAIYSYNHAIETINDYVKEQVTTLNIGIDEENVRSVGSNPSAPYSENTTMYTSSRLESWYSTYNGVGKSGDANYEQDLIRMSYYGVADINDSYWLASRFVGESSGRVYFYVGTVNSNGNYGSDHLWYVVSSSNAYGGPNSSKGSYSVRPVIKVTIE